MYLERIDLLCALKGISQSKLASDLGINKQALNNYIKFKIRKNEKNIYFYNICNAVCNVIYCFMEIM